MSQTFENVPAEPSSQSGKNNLLTGNERLVTSLLHKLEERTASFGGVLQPLLRVLSQYVDYAELLLKQKTARAEYLATSNGQNAKAVTNIDISLKNLAMAMTYPNLPVWVLYKYFAYQPDSEINKQLAEAGLSVSSHPISTLGDLVRHGLSRPGYIFGRRLHYLAREYAKTAQGVETINGIDPWKMLPAHEIEIVSLFSVDMPLPELLSTPKILALLSHEFSDRWYELENSRYCKWENYPEGRLDLGNDLFTGNLLES